MKQDLTKKNPPKYVGVYTQILQMIQNGVYPKGSKIPSEIELSKEMGVSRMTLRQALALLQEDGILESKQGLGNFVKDTPTEKKQGLETKGNPVYKCLNVKIDRVETEYRLDVSDNYTDMIFHRSTAAFFGVTRKYYHEDECVGFSFSYIPADMEEFQSVDLNADGQLEEFLDKEIYEKAHLAQTNMTTLKTGREFKNEVSFALDLKYTLSIKELLVNNKGEVLVYTKYTLPLEKMEMDINQYN